MKQKDKELLLKDLCARLPYGVKASVYSYWNEEYLDDSIVGVDIEEDEFFCSIVPGVRCPIIKTKPYLFPMSSMTDEQKEEYYSLADDVTIKPGQGYYFGIKIHCIKLGISDNPHEGLWDWIDLDAIDWLNKNHFDYRGLIEKGLAIDATGLNIY